MAFNYFIILDLQAFSYRLLSGHIFRHFFRSFYYDTNILVTLRRLNILRLLLCNWIILPLLLNFFIRKNRSLRVQRVEIFKLHFKALKLHIYIIWRVGPYGAHHTLKKSYFPGTNKNCGPIWSSPQHWQFMYKKNKYVVYNLNTKGKHIKDNLQVI